MIEKPLLLPILILVIWLGACCPLHADTTISQIAGQAADHVLTTREAKIDYFIETALFADPKKERLEMNWTAKKYDLEVSRVLMEILVNKEASAFGISLVPEDDISKAISVVKTFANLETNRQSFNSLLASSSEIREIVSRKLRAKKFIQFKTQASVVPSTDAEALQYFQKNRSKFGNAPFSQFKESIKSFLSQTQANQRIGEWFDLLQKKYHIRKIVNSGSSASTK